MTPRRTYGPEAFSEKDRQRGSGGGKGIRTPDPLLAKQVLSQLSYAPKTKIKVYLPGLRMKLAQNVHLLELLS
jgi:hypothetical protein